jgi:hemerythrin-like domain-containing protein
MPPSPPPATADFNDPLAVMHADHVCILEHCDMLEQLVSHIVKNGVDTEARDAMSRVVNCFSVTAVQHLQDKDQNLFPILNRQSLKLADIIYRLKKEQAELNGLWTAIHSKLKTAATLSSDEAFTHQVDQFCKSYRHHLAYESRELLSLARHILSQRQLEEIGDAMAKRRGVRR